MSKQLLSQALDESLSREEWDALLDATEADAELGGIWARSWASRDARQGLGIEAAGGVDFAAGVMARIAAESNAEPVASAKVVALPRASTARATTPRRTDAAPAQAPRVSLASADSNTIRIKPVVRTRNWARWGVPAAAGAGALAAVMVAGQWLQTSTKAVVATAPVAAPQALTASVPQVGEWRTVATTGNNSAAAAAADAELLDDYLLDHASALVTQQVSPQLSGARFAVQPARYAAQP